MQRFRDISITRKLRLIAALTNVLALLIAATAYIAFERVASRKEMVRMLTVLADAVGLHGAAALSFRDEAAARETLAGLQADPHVKAGTLFENNGTVFATYKRDADVPLIATPPDREVEFHANSILVTRPVLLNDKRLGTVCVESDMELLRRRLLRLAGIVAGAIAVALVLTMAFTQLLQRSIARPINTLADMAHSISERKDYSVRAALSKSQDEIGVLTAAFNQMLESIQEREAAQRLNAQRLESLVQLNQMTDATPRQLTGFALEECVRLTRSTTGYLAFVNEDGEVIALHSWPPTDAESGPVDTGLWSTVITERKPVLVNDATSSSADAPTCPASVARRCRHMDIPLFDGDRIVAVAGAGNKNDPYDESDVQQATLLLQGMWRLIQRRDAEDELIRHRDHLEDLVAERAADLKKTNAELERTTAELQRSNEELEQFAYVASHDLQEPLRKVASFTQLLAEHYEDKLDSEAREFIAYAVDGAHRMQGLINDLLAYSRVGTRGKPFAPVDGETVFERAVANLELAIRESGAQVVHERLPTVMGDEVQLMQLFQNLIGNAIKFSCPGVKPDVHVAAEKVMGQSSSGKDNDQCPMTHDAAKPPMTHDAAQPPMPNDAFWLFSVRDNGIGIEPQYFERLFVIFQRLHSRSEFPGTGIGLAISKKIVERHGGRIWVESGAGKGSIFKFTIPQR